MSRYATEIRPPAGFEPSPNQHLPVGSRHLLTTKLTRLRLLEEVNHLFTDVNPIATIVSIGYDTTVVSA